VTWQVIGLTQHPHIANMVLVRLRAEIELSTFSVEILYPKADIPRLGETVLVFLGQAQR
jgi:hypothetical protein